jgi:hypothetical protein
MRYSSVVLFVAPLFLSCEASRPFPKLGRDDASAGIFATYATGTGTAGYATGTGTAGYAPTSASKPMPTDSPKKACHGTDNVYWTPLDVAIQAIKDFCGQPDLNVHDPGSGSRQRTFNNNTLTEISIAIDWPQGTDIELNPDDCEKQMTKILDSKSSIHHFREMRIDIYTPDCDGNNPNNLLNWKHGGNLTVGPIVYHVDPLVNRYATGRCSAITTQCVVASANVFWSQTSVQNGYSFTIMNDNTTLAMHRSSDPLVISNVLYDNLTMTPGLLPQVAASQTSSAHFQVGDQNWSTNDPGRYGTNILGPNDGLDLVSKLLMCSGCSYMY